MLGLLTYRGIGGVLPEPGSVVVFDVVGLSIEDVENVADQIVPAVRFPSGLRVVRHRCRRNCVSRLIQNARSEVSESKAGGVIACSLTVTPAEVTTLIDSGT